MTDNGRGEGRSFIEGEKWTSSCVELWTVRNMNITLLLSYIISECSLYYKDTALDD